MKTLLLGISVLLTSANLFASSEGIDQEKLNQYSITGFSRPCCTFAPNPVNEKLGIAKIIEEKDLGVHDFARFNKIKDSVGMMYTCRGGFIDISHLRDNADWSAHIYFNLDKWLGSGEDIPARREGGFESRSVYFPKLSQEEIASLTEEDKAQLAISIGFTMALLHEIPTAFKIPVSSPHTLITYEQASAFSVEDAYSNLSGNILGVAAARDPRPYNVAMEEMLKKKIRESEPLLKIQTNYIYDMLKDVWWKKTLQSKLSSVLKRNYEYEGTIGPELVNDVPFCKNPEPLNIEVPNQLSNGKSVNDYYQLRAVMKKKLIKNFERANIFFETQEFSQFDYPQIIENLEVYLEGLLEKYRKTK